MGIRREKLEKPPGISRKFHATTANGAVVKGWIEPDYLDLDPGMMGICHDTVFHIFHSISMGILGRSYATYRRYILWISIAGWCFGFHVFHDFPEALGNVLIHPLTDFKSIHHFSGWARWRKTTNQIIISHIITM